MGCDNYHSDNCMARDERIEEIGKYDTHAIKMANMKSSAIAVITDPRSLDVYFLMLSFPYGASP